MRACACRARIFCTLTTQFCLGVTYVISPGTSRNAFRHHNRTMLSLTCVGMGRAARLELRGSSTCEREGVPDLREEIPRAGACLPKALSPSDEASIGIGEDSRSKNTNPLAYAVSKINTDYETGLCVAMAFSIIHINF